MTDIFRSISHLNRLESFSFPRACSNDPNPYSPLNSWPSKLKKLELAGGLRDESILYFATVPDTLTHLTIANGPHLSMFFIRPLADFLGAHLERLRIETYLPNLEYHSLEDILDILPALRHFTVAIEYISKDFFMPSMVYTASNPHRLRSLKLSSLYLDLSLAIKEITADTVWTAVVDGPLKNLRKLQVCQFLQWSRNVESRRGVKDLGAMLEALAREDCEGVPDDELNAGLWIVP